MKTSDEILSESAFIIANQAIENPLTLDNKSKKIKIKCSLKENDSLSDTITVNTKNFPYTFLEDDEVVIFLKYTGDEKTEKVPWCSGKEVFHPFTYSYNNTIEELIFPDGIEYI